jgi:hypothetical protein
MWCNRCLSCRTYSSCCTLLRQHLSSSLHSTVGGGVEATAAAARYNLYNYLKAANNTATEGVGWAGALSEPPSATGLVVPGTLCVS